MTSPDPIARVSVISTGTVAIRPEHVGPTRKNMYFWLFTSRRWTAPRPINVYVIEHREGLVLFDIGPDQTLTAGLRKLGHGVEDVRTAVISHLHQDHIGGLPELGRSQITVSRQEWESLARPLPEARGLMPSHIDLPGLRWNRVEPERLADASLAPFGHGHDLFADGSLLLLPTPGHTPGSLSMLVRRPGHRPLLMVGDLTYDDRLLADGKLPGVGDKGQMRTTTRMVNELRTRLPGLVVLPAHDPYAAERLATALERD